MMKSIRSVLLGLFAILWLPVGGMAVAITTAERSADTQPSDAQGRAQAKAGSASTDQQKKSADQGDVQSRGLFSKKKKKKPVGGAAGHAESSNREDLPAHGRSMEGK
jgi:hypothetical protein